MSLLAEVAPQMRQMHKEGLSAAQIAVRLKVNPRTIVRWRVAMGLARPAPRLLTAHEKARALDMLTDGASYNEVGRTIGRSAAAIARAFPGHGWTRLECGQFSAFIYKNSPGEGLTQK